MNFWLKYTHSKHEGQGYRMSKAQEGDTETIGQMFIDDSNWFATTVANTGAMLACQYVASCLSAFLQHQQKNGNVRSNANSLAFLLFYVSSALERSRLIAWLCYIHWLDVCR